MSRTALVLLILSSIGCSSRSDEHERARAEGASETNAHRETIVSVDPRAIKRMGIKVTQVEALPSQGGLRLPAEIHPDPDRVAHISSVVSGQLSSVNAAVGDRVEADQVLAVVQSVELGQARSEAERARATFQAAEANFARQQELQNEGIGAAKNFVAAKAELARARAEVDATRRALAVYGRGGKGSEVLLRSPIRGHLVQRHATVGEIVSPGDTLFEVTDIEHVWVLGRAYQQDAGQVELGVAAKLTLQAYPGRSWSGHIDYIAPTLDETTRTLRVRMSLDNPDGTLRPGLFGRLELAPSTESSTTAAFVHSDAVQRIAEQDVVFVPEAEEGRFHAVPVALGARREGFIQVVSGLAPGDSYVSTGAFVLKSELLRAELGEGHAH